MKYEVDTDAYNDVGPYTELYEHAPVCIITSGFGDPDEGTLHVCMGCGYTAHDTRLFLDAECDPEQNNVAETWQERFDERGVDEVFNP